MQIMACLVLSLLFPVRVPLSNAGHDSFYIEYHICPACDAEHDEGMKLEQFEHCGNGPIVYSDPFAAYLTETHQSVADVMKHGDHVYGTESLNSKSMYHV